MPIRLKRAYDAPAEDDGCRVLVDRLWPRGVSKEAAALDRWLKEVAPSAELRRWFGHDPEKWDAFRHRYRKELDDHDEAIAFLRKKSRAGTLTLVYGAKDTAHNDAVVLRDYLLEHGGEAP